MKTADWEKIKEIFNESLELPPDEREAFIVKACRGDEKIIGEVRELIQSFEDDEDFLENEAVGAVADLIVGAPEMSAETASFGRYRLKSLLGEGGMGRVFLAEDVELERKAAVKILSPLLSRDENRVRRFVYEAKAASSLNHPNILTIYEIGQAQESHYIATEYIEGETLRERLNEHGVTLREILEIGVQITSALAAAHEARIIHRDIKPENIMLRRDRLVKVLDFGLAKLVTGESEENAQTNKNAMHTAQGVVLGTAAYMSPEQARGLAADARTDLWSLGVCLYEMASGRQPFAGETSSDVIAEILTREAPPLDRKIPAEFVRIVTKALQKKPSDRYASAVALLADLTALRDSLKDTDAETRASVYHEVSPTIEKKKKTAFANFTTGVLTNFRTFSAKSVAAALLFLLLVAAALAGGAYFYRGNSAAAVISPEALRWYESGRAAARGGSFHKALKMLERSIELDDRHLPAHAALAEVLMELDYEDKAAQTMLRVTELMPQTVLTDAENDYLQAVLATVRRDHKTAAAVYEEITETAAEPEKTYSYFNYGRALEKSNETEAAAAAYREAVGRDAQFAAAFLRLANLYWLQKKQTEALEAFDRAAAVYTAESDYDGLGELFYEKGNLYNFSDNLPEAEKNLSKSLELAAATSNQPLRIKTLFNLGRIGYSTGDTTRAGQFIDEALNLAEKENLENLTTNGLVDLGTLFYFKGEYEKAAGYLEQALRTARSAGSPKTAARAQLALGNLALLRVRPADAVRFTEAALEYYNRSDSFRQEKSQAALALGYAYDQTGRYAAALELLGKVKNQAETENDEPLVAHTASAIGLTQIHAENFPAAVASCEQSFTINQKLGRDQIAAYALLNKAQALLNLGDFAAARAALGETLRTAAESKDVQLAAWSHLLLGHAALHEGKHQETIAASRKAIEISGGQVAEIVISANVAAALAEMRANRTEKAANLLQTAETAVEKIENSRLLPFVQIARAELFLHEKKQTEALGAALAAEKIFAAQEANFSVWRARAIAARAASELGDAAAANEHARRAEEISRSLQKLWGDAYFQSFQKRSDADFYQSGIERALRETKTFQ